MLIQFHTTLRKGDDEVVSEPIYLPQKVEKASLSFLEGYLPKIVAYYDQFLSKKVIAVTISEKEGENREKKVTFRTSMVDYRAMLVDFMKKDFESIYEEPPFGLFMVEDLVGWDFENAFVDKEDRLIVTFSNKELCFQYQIERKREYHGIEAGSYKHYDFVDAAGKRYLVDYRNSDFYPGDSWDVSQELKGEVKSIGLSKGKFRIETAKGWIEWGAGRDGFVKLTDITEDEVIVSAQEGKDESYRVEGSSYKEASNRIFHGVCSRNRYSCGLSYTESDYRREHKDFRARFSIVDNRTNKELLSVYGSKNMDYKDLGAEEARGIAKLQAAIGKINESGDFTTLKSLVYCNYDEFFEKVGFKEEV